MAPSREIEKLQRRWQENSLGLTFAPLAEAYRKEGLYSEALELLSIGLAQHPNYVPAHIVKGRCLVDTFQDAGAEEAFQRVLDLDPENVIALKGLADIAERSGRLREARTRLQRILEFDRSNDEARFQLDRIQAIIGDDPPLTPTPSETAGAESFVAVVDVSPPPVEPAEQAPPAEDPADGEIPRAAVVEFDQAEVVLYQPLDFSGASSYEPSAADSAPASEEGLEAEPAPSESNAAPEITATVTPVVEGFHSWDPPVDALSSRSIEAPEEPVDAADPLAEFASEGADPLAAAFAVTDPASSAEFMAPEAEASAAPMVPEAEPVVAESTAEQAPTEQPAAAHPAVESEPAEQSDAAEPVAASTPVSEPAIAAASAVESQTAPAEGGETEALETSVEVEVEAVAEPDPTPRDEDAEAVAGFEADPELVVTETMAEIFLRQGHRELALAIYTQLATKEPENTRIAEAIDRLQQELRPEPASALPAYAAVLTGGQSVRSFFEKLLSVARPGAAPAAPAGPSLDAVFGDGSPAATGATATGDVGPSYDEFYGDEPAAPADIPAPAAASDDPAADDLEGFTSWLKGLKR